MEKEFVPYDRALKMKELGFNEPCLFLYNSTDDDPKPFLASPPQAMDWNTLYIEKTNKHLMSSPTFSQVFRWFREKHELISSIYQLSVNVKTGLSSFEYMIDKLNNLGLSQFIEDFPYNTYEEAEIACLENLIELVESKSE